ncbi:MAG TPA: hypothetical protein VH500_23365, partial [Nitrososphaeraceae archaeon]
VLFTEEKLLLLSLSPSAIARLTVRILAVNMQGMAIIALVINKIIKKSDLLFINNVRESTLIRIRSAFTSE